MRILQTKNVPVVIMIVVIVIFGLSVGKPYAVTLEELRSGAVMEIIIGDIKFHSWEFGNNPSPWIDPTKMYVTPINDPINPGLSFDTTGQLDASKGSSTTGWRFSFRVSTISGEAIIESHSVELTDFEYAAPPLNSNILFDDILNDGVLWQTVLGSEYPNIYWPDDHFYRDFDSVTLGPHSTFKNTLNFQVTPWQLPSSINTFELKYHLALSAPLDVDIDIKPGSDPNCFNNDGHGVIPVAILGGIDFDVLHIDVSTLKFSGLDVRVKGNDQPQCSINDVSGDFTDLEGTADGYPDLICQFVDDADNWLPDDGTATLTGNLLPEYGGKEFQATDSICIVQ